MCLLPVNRLIFFKLVYSSLIKAYSIGEFILFDSYAVFLCVCICNLLPVHPYWLSFRDETLNLMTHTAVLF